MYRYRVTKSDNFRNASFFEIHDLVSDTYKNVNLEQLKELIRGNTVTNMTLNRGHIVDCPDVAANIYDLLAMSEVEFSKMQKRVANRRGYVY